MAVYGLVIVAILKGRKTDDRLKSPFFNLILSMGVTDILAAVQTWFLLRLRCWGLFFDFYSRLDPVCEEALL